MSSINENAMQLMSAMMGANFAKACVVNSSYQCLGATAQDAGPRMWVDDSDKESKPVQINENQELANDWAAQFKKGKFHFFGLKWNFSGQADNNMITCTRKPNDKSKLNGLIAVQRNTCWIVCAFRMRPMMSKRPPEKGEFKDLGFAIKAFEAQAEDHGFEKDD